MKIEKIVTLCCPNELSSLFINCTTLSDYICVAESLSEDYVYCVRFNDKVDSTVKIKDYVNQVSQGTDVVEYCKITYPRVKQEAYLFVFNKDDYNIYRSVDEVQANGVQPSVWTTAWGVGKPLTQEENRVLLETYRGIVQNSVNEFMEDVRTTFKLDETVTEENGKLSNSKDLDEEELQKFKEKWGTVYPEDVKQWLNKVEKGE